MKNDLMMPTTKTTMTRSSITLGASYRKKATLLPRRLEGASLNTSYVRKSAALCSAR